MCNPKITETRAKSSAVRVRPVNFAMLCCVCATTNIAKDDIASRSNGSDFAELAAIVAKTPNADNKLLLKIAREFDVEDTHPNVLYVRYVYII